LPRHPASFDLDEEDFLTEYPVFDSFKFGEIDPPNWALRAIQKRGGRRHAKREILHPTYTPVHLPYHGFTPAKPAGGYSPAFPPGSDALAIFNKATSKAKSSAKSSARRRAQLNKAQQISQRPLVPKGNLINDDYRYWRGFAISNARPGSGTCRWCQVLFNDREEMLTHHSKSPCKQLLTALYRFAKQGFKFQYYCFSCKKVTDNFYWGVPMCDDVQCYTKWKFNFNVQLWGYQQYREWALKKQLDAGLQGPFGNLLSEKELEAQEDYYSGHC
jgi:hypothetical protein